MRGELTGLIQQYTLIHQGRPWMGRNFQSTIEDMPSELVFTQVPTGAPAIAQQLDHITFWRLQAIEKLHGKVATKKDQDPANWRSIEELKRIGWKTVVADYQQALEEYLRILRAQKDSFLDSTYYDPDFEGEFAFRFLLQGVLHHDIYHLGQIRQLITMFSNSENRVQG